MHLLKDMLKEFQGNLYCDNESAVKIITDIFSNKRARNTDCEFHITNPALFEKKKDNSTLV
jgi:hypothetical protein